MKIYCMTATFGKLENQTLRLDPGLNVIHAPNEWGKTTWCAFLVTMLYGLDTREKTTKNALAVKERYAPWSGSPMSGRIDLQWNGRDITIERYTKGRTPMGEFRAYETASGLTVPELTAAGCGETLLGVEKSVFVRSGFLRLADLPVTADDALRHRLNALVTTGDDSGAGDELAQKLKDLKNKCRYNRSGLLPQAEQQQRMLADRLSELRTLQVQRQNLQQRQKELENLLSDLENHKLGLQYAAAMDNIRRVAQAQEAAQKAAQKVARLEAACADQLSREEVLAQLQQYAQLQQSHMALQQQKDTLPPEPLPPQIPQRYRQMTAQQAAEQTHAELDSYMALQKQKKKTGLWWLLWGGIAALSVAVAAVAGTAGVWLGALAAVVLGALGIWWSQRAYADKLQRRMQQIGAQYPLLPPEQWLSYVKTCTDAQQQYQQALQKHRDWQQQIDTRLHQVQQALAELTGGTDGESYCAKCNAILADYDALTQARRDSRSAADHAAALQEMVGTVPAPERPDSLTLSEAETEHQLAKLGGEYRQLQHMLGQYQGMMETQGSERDLENQLTAVTARIEKLNLTYRALELALQTLEKAAGELQRRFAPRITEQARELFGKLTGGRYDRLTWQQDLTVQAGSVDEIALHSAQWRSEGTVDQLYFALRLAVARELTPQMPLILDDALVRFDDQRHAAAMEILRQEAENKQVIVFTCQSREKI